MKYTRWNNFVAHLRGLLPPKNNENYDKHWNYVSFKGKVVLDLGADYGSTTSYFLYRGAKQVIAVEGDKELAETLRKNFLNETKVISIELFIKSSEDIENLINEYNPDIVKMDIEGGELNLLKYKHLKKVKEWLIECHNEEIRKKLENLFSQEGFTTSTVEYGKMINLPHLTVLVAIRQVRK